MFLSFSFSSSAPPISADALFDVTSEYISICGVVEFVKIDILRRKDSMLLELYQVIRIFY